MPIADGVIVVDKPAGPTSHDIVAVVRRALGISRIGHTGTLDPLATGVLPLVVGRATRLATFLSGAEKEYVAHVRFGATSETYDAEGIERQPSTMSGPVPAGAPEIAAVLPRFSGRYLQQPPPYSAKKIGGTPAYKLARQKAEPAIKPVEVNVRELELRGYDNGVAEVRLVCSSGFYVRRLAHDLGAALGCGAFLERLRRTRVGSFSLDDARGLEEIVAAGRAAASLLVPMAELLPELPSAILNEQGLRRAAHGNTLGPGDFQGEPAIDRGAAVPKYRLMDGSGRLVGIADWQPTGLLHPSIVLV